MAMSAAVRRIATFIAAIAPAAVVWVEKVVLHPRPVAVAYADPEVYFFYDSLRLVLGTAPHNVDHPGTPVQLLGAIVLRFTGATPLAIEAYRNAMYTIALALNALAVLFLLRTLLRRATPLGAIAAIWTFWICPAAVRHVAIWSPEAIYFLVAGLAAAALHAYVSERSPARAAWLGAAIGLCIATKFVFVAWAVAAVAILLPRWKDIAAFIGGAGAAFVIATLPAITRYDAMFRWLVALATRRDWYGRTQPAAATGSVAADLASAVMHAKAWHLWIAIAVIAAFLLGRRAIVLFGVIAIAANYAMAAKGIVPKAVDSFGDIRYRYVLPAAAAAMLLIAEACRNRRTPRLLLLGAAGILVIKASSSEIRTHRTIVAEGAEHRAAIETAVKRFAPPGAVIVYDGAEVPSYALRAHTYGEERFLRMVEQGYPHDAHMYDFITYLPHGAARWDLFVIRPSMLPRSPAKDGIVIGEAGGHLLVRPR